MKLNILSVCDGQCGCFYSDSPVPAPSGTYSFHPKAGGIDKIKLYNHVSDTKNIAQLEVIFLAVNGRTTKKQR